MDCLLTQLKGSVIITDLPVLGMIKVAVPTSGTNTTLLIRTSQQTKAVALNGTWVLSGTTENTTNAHYVNVSAFTLTNPSDDYMEALIPKYHITSIEATNPGTINIDDLKDSDSQTLIVKVNGNSGLGYKCVFKGTAGGFAEKVSGQVQMRNIRFEDTFDVSELGKSGGITTFDMATAENVKGSFVNLAYSLGLTSFVLHNDCSFVCEDYVAIRRELGETTGSVSINYLGSAKSTFNGHSIPSQPNNTLSWTPTTITLNGETIDA